MHHLLHPLQKCNNLRDRGHPYNFQICGRRTARTSTDYKILAIIQQRVQSTKVQDVKDLMQRLIDAWVGVEVSVIQDVIDH